METPPQPLSQSTPRNIYAFGLTSFLNDTASEMAYWVLPAFLASLGAGPAQLGIIEGTAESVASFAKLFSGYLADKVSHRKPIVVGGYFVANAVKPLLALVSSWWQILGIRFCDRLAKGVRGTARDVMVAESVDRSNIGSAYGLIQALDSAGAIAGPLLALAIIGRFGRFGMRAVFASAAIPGALCVVVAWLGIREVHRRVNPLAEDGANPELLRPRAAAELGSAGQPRAAVPTRTLRLRSGQAREGARPHTSKSEWLPKLPGNFYYVLAVVTLFSLGNSSDMFLVLRAGNIGIPAARAPLLGLVFNIMFTLLSWPAGKFSDHFSRSAIAATGYFVFALVYFVFALAPSQLAIWLTMAFYGLFYALTNPVLKALVVESVAGDVRGRALGIYFFLTSVTTLLASVITGALWKIYGPAVPFYFSAGIASVSAFALLAHRTPARD
jgi:MFS family permease